MTSMTTLQLLENCNEPPYQFVSLGREIYYRLIDNDYEKMVCPESKLFPKGTIVTMTSGTFPLPKDMKDFNSSEVYTIGGKQVYIVAYTCSCYENQLNKYGKAKIDVVYVKPQLVELFDKYVKKMMCKR